MTWRILLTVGGESCEDAAQACDFCKILPVFIRICSCSGRRTQIAFIWAHPLLSTVPGGGLPVDFGRATPGDRTARLSVSRGPRAAALFSAHRQGRDEIETVAGRLCRIENERAHVS